MVGGLLTQQQQIVIDSCRLKSGTLAQHQWIVLSNIICMVYNIVYVFISVSVASVYCTETIVPLWSFVISVVRTLFTHLD